MTRFRALRLGAIAMMLSALVTASAAGAGTIGREFAAGDRGIPPRGWWTSCTDASGKSVELTPDCRDVPCDQSTDLMVALTDVNGAPLGDPVTVNTAPAHMSTYRLSCHPSGWFVAQWRDAASSCFLHRVFASDASVAGAPSGTIPAGGDCRTRASLAVEAGGAFVAAWAEPALWSTSRILAQHFDSSGDPTGSAEQVSESNLGRNRRQKIAMDDSGTALLAWTGTAAEGLPEPVLVRFMTTQPGLAFPGGELQVNTFEFGENSDPAIVANGNGSFEILWTNVLQGGRVGRLVHINAGSQTTTTTTLPPTESMPSFGAARIVDASTGTERYADALDSGIASTWLLQHRHGSYRRSGDDSVNWQSPPPPHSGVPTRVVSGSDEAGVWVALNTLDQSDRVTFARSIDDAATWSDPLLLAHSGSVSVDCGNCSVGRAAVEGSATGTWIAAWTFSDSSQTEPALERLYLARSPDGALQWSIPVAAASEQGLGLAGFDLATDGAGTWVLLWADQDIKMIRSTDDGNTWSQTQTLVAGIACLSCNSLRYFTRVDLEAGADDVWLAVFASQRYRNGDYGYDGDVFVIRSDDAGASWSQPAPVAVYADRDGSRDTEPSIASDGDGRWLALWTSHHPIDSADDLASDVFGALSTDAGVRWAAPTIIKRDDDKTTSESAALLASDARGVWIATWLSSPLGADGSGDAGRILVAAAEAECGNGLIEVGEQCDDGNLEDDDGCDSNCLTTGCGNAVVTAGEECDDGNGSDTDDCTGDCRAAHCGDGYVYQGVEQCDDGNESDTDYCLSDCRLARCGDGVVEAGVETCDGDNDENHDGCSSGCEPAACGDGEVEVGVEACDDGNHNDNDGCPNDCVTAVCGNGYTSVGFEQCDYTDPNYAGICTEECLMIDICGDANGDGQVSVNDALRILKHGVGLGIDCPQGACDMDASGAVSSTDAGMALVKSVGIPVGDRCSIGTGMLVFWIDDPREIAAFQFDVDYADTGGNFTENGGEVQCETVANVTAAAYHDDHESKVLTAGFITIEGLQGPADLFRCEFELPQVRNDTRLTIIPTDASDPDTNPLLPFPLVGYRLE